MFAKKHFANFTGKKLKNLQDYESEIFSVLLLHEHKHIDRVSNLHQYTLRGNKKHLLSFLENFH